jgi:hypothetical protein
MEYLILLCLIKNIVLASFSKGTTDPYFDTLRQGTLYSHLQLAKPISIVGKLRKAKYTKFRFNKINNNNQNTKDTYIKPHRNQSNAQ